MTIYVILLIYRLPVAGAKEVKPLQSTPSGSRSNLSTPSTKVDPSSGPSKRNSFVEVSTCIFKQMYLVRIIVVKINSMPA